jgi:hypothetical protein
MPAKKKAEAVVIPEQLEAPDNIVAPTEVEVVKREPMTAFQKLKEEVDAKRAGNLDTGFVTTDFDINHAIEMVMELDKYTKISVFNSWKFFLNMNCIRQALRIMPEHDEKTLENREDYDNAIRVALCDHEIEDTFQTKLPAFIELNETLRTIMYDNMLEPSTMEDTLEFMADKPPSAANFEKDYEERVRQGQRPGISKRDFCDLQLDDAMKSHRLLSERGQSAIEFCNDLNDQQKQGRGFGDLPDWAIDTLYNKLADKLVLRWQKLDIRRTGLRTKPADRTEAEADQTLVEFVYKELTGREFATEY